MAEGVGLLLFIIEIEEIRIINVIDEEGYKWRVIIE